MKHLYIIIIILTAGLISCENDFDEMQDSDLRHITFTFDPSHLFDEVLVERSGEYSLGTDNTIDRDHLLRITSYCYDASDSLLQHYTLLCKDLSTVSQTFRHLDKNATYQFQFVADVVLSDPDVDYYETWYQMATRNRQSFYFFSDSRSQKPQNDVMQMATFKARPSNQSVAVQFEPLTLNGYCILTNTNNVDRITGYAAYVNAFMMSTKSWKRRASLAYEFSYYRPAVPAITLPLNMSYADSIVFVKVKSTRLAGTDSIMVNVPNDDRRPFVLTIDCEALQLKDVMFY